MTMIFLERCKWAWLIPFSAFSSNIWKSANKVLFRPFFHEIKERRIRLLSCLWILGTFCSLLLDCVIQTKIMTATPLKFECDCAPYVGGRNLETLWVIFLLSSYLALYLSTILNNWNISWQIMNEDHGSAHLSKWA